MSSQKSGFFVSLPKLLYLQEAYRVRIIPQEAVSNKTIVKIAALDLLLILCSLNRLD
ncbi:hypothetical protein DESC_580037 [Desulfosarcina cetonica]|nr:hypothetical protein DESC_580037 [Desulfosarcina cetonica]